MSKKEEKSKATRARIIDVARNMFAEHGFAETSQADVVSAAGVTTGAIYHHFGDKKGLFLAVAEQIEQELLDYVVKQLDLSKLDVPTLVKGAELTLEFCSEPGVQRIIFRDAPTLFGQREWRETEIKYAYGAMNTALHAMANMKEYNIPNPELTAQIILGSIIELAHAVAEADDGETAIEQAKEMVERIVPSMVMRK